MAITYENTSQSYTASASQTVFPFSELHYITGQSSTLKVYVDGLLIDSADYLITEGTVTGRVVNGGTLTFNDALAGGETVLINRETPSTQPLNITDANTQQAVDRLTLQVAEAKEAVSNPQTVTGIGLVYEWAEITNYYENQVVDYSLKLYRCLEDHQSTNFITDLISGKWVELDVAGPKGDTGSQGLKGDKGDTGAKGDTGVAGADGIFSEIASEVEATAGVENTKGMTSLRTAQAIETQVENTTWAQAIQAQADATEATASGNTGVLASHNLRISSLENKMSSAILNATMDLPNNTVEEQLTYEDPNNPPARLPVTVDANVARAYVIEFAIDRGDDDDQASISGWLYLNYKGVDWELNWEYMGWDAGVTWTVITDGLDQTATIYATTSDYAGANYYGTIKYSLREMGKGVL